MHQPGGPCDPSGSTPPNMVTTSFPLTSNADMLTFMKPINQNVSSGVNNQHAILSQTVTSGSASGQQMMPNAVQIIQNIQPNTQQIINPKSVLSPRVVIGPQMVGIRPTAPGINLQSVSGLQPGQQGHLLLKTESGQYQLLRVGPGPAPTQGLRLSTPQGTAAHSTTGPPPLPFSSPVVTQQVSTPTPTSSLQVPQIPPSTQSQTVLPQIPIQPVPPMVSTVGPKPLDNTKIKCKNFLANLLDLSSKEPKNVEDNARTLIQELIDALVEPEQFCDRLERLLNASPQPCLIGFLKKSLPSLRQSLVTKELIIEGIRPPPTHVAFSPVLATSQDHSIRSGSPAPQIQSASSVPKVIATRPGTTNLNKSISILQNIQIQPQKMAASKMIPKFAPTINNPFTAKNMHRELSSSGIVTSSQKSVLRDREKKPVSSHTQSYSDIEKVPTDDDINDVAAMGGVNLAEESQNILGSTDLIGTNIRSCKDEYFLPLHLLQNRIRTISAQYGLQEPGFDVAVLVSHATQERLKNLIEKLSSIAEHRLENVKTDPRYEVTQDVKGQLKFLEELDAVENKRRNESEREMLMKAVKSRSKNEDAEQAKLKAKAKEMQRAEMEEVRQREANATALQAIGPRKKPKIDIAGSSDAMALGAATHVPNAAPPMRGRIKRVNYRDLLFLMEQEKNLAHSGILYKAYLKTNKKN